MKKIIALLMVCGFAFAFVACGGGAKNEAASEDTTAVAPAATPDTTMADTTATDTTAAQ
jgi:hypothetical protein